MQKLQFGYCNQTTYRLQGLNIKGGGGVHPVFIVKLDFEIAVDQQTNQTFDGVLDSGCPPVPTGQQRPYLVNFWFNFAKSP